MRNKSFLITIIFLISLFLYNCSEVKEDITQPPELEGVHPDGFGKVGSDNFHSNELRKLVWNMESCQKCHAADFSGGTANVSCLTCHTENAGPEACNTCHGSFANENLIAPPTDLDNNTSTTSKGVGAHSSHVYTNSLSMIISCNECHPTNETGSTDYVKTHINGLPAEMNFGEIASSGLSVPQYNNMDLTCSNTYCHGNFQFSKDDSENQWGYTDSLITGENFSPEWTKVDSTQAACGTCHLLPPRGHLNADSDPTASTCINCHSSAFNEDGTINKLTHINGEKNLN